MPVPVVAGQVTARPVERVDRLALVQLQHPRAVVAFDHPRVLVRRLRLVQHPAGVGSLDRPHRCEDSQSQRRRQRGKAPAEARRGNQGERAGKDEKGALRPQQRDQQQGRDHRPEERAGGRDRVEPPHHLARVLAVAHSQPHGPGRGGAEQGHRDRDQHQDSEQRAGEAADRDAVEGVDREAEKGPGGEGDGGDQHRGTEDQETEAAQVRVAVGVAAAEPVADRECDQDDADRVRPDDRRGAEVGRQQARRGDLGAEAGGADDEDQRRQQPPCGRAAS